MDERNSNNVSVHKDDYEDDWADLFKDGDEKEDSEEEHLLSGQSTSQNHKHTILKTAHLTLVSFGLVSQN